MGVSHFSKNNHTNSASPFETENEDDLNDINIEIQDIIDAIDKLEENSAPGPDGVPAIFLKKTKEVIAPHLTNMLRRSLDEGKIPLLQNSKTPKLQNSNTPKLQNSKTPKLQNT